MIDSSLIMLQSVKNAMAQDQEKIFIILKRAANGMKKYETLLLYNAQVTNKYNDWLNVLNVKKINLIF